jgi:anti-sigma factor RsiW
MMNCRKARPLLAMLAAGELYGDERKALEEHLKICRDCGRELESLKQVMRLIEVPQGAPEKVEAPALVLSALSSPAPRAFPYRAVAWAAAAVVLVGMFLGVGVQVKVDEGTVVLAFGRGVDLGQKAFAAEDARAISREVMNESLEEEIAPSLLALTSAIESMDSRQNEQFGEALAGLDETWQERFGDLRLEILDTYRATMGQIFQTNSVVNEQTEWLEALLASTDLQELGLEEGAVK